MTPPADDASDANDTDDKAQKEAYLAWLAERPEHVRRVAETLPPWFLYRLKTTGQIVFLISFEEHDGSCMPPTRGPHTGEPCRHCATRAVTVTVGVTQANNPHLLIAFDREVFGVDPADLEPIPPTPHATEVP